MKQRELWLRLSLVLISFVLYAGTVWDNHWSPVDDGGDLERMVQSRQRIAQGQFTFQPPTSGLFRPTFALLRMGEYALGGSVCSRHHVLHLLVMVGLVQLLFSIVHRATDSSRAAWLVAALYTLFSPNVENWFRLDDPSFYPTFCAVFSLWCMTRALSRPPERAGHRRLAFAAAVAVLVPAYFTKETSMAFAGLGLGLFAACCVGAGGLLARRNRALTGAYLAAHLAMAAAWFLLRGIAGIKSISGGDYTSNYAVSPIIMLATAFKYADVVWNGFQFLTIIALGLFVSRVLRRLKMRQPLDAVEGWFLVGACWFGATLTMMLPWKYPLARYLGPGVPGLAMAVGLMLWDALRKTGAVPDAGRRHGEQWLRWVVVANLAVLPAITAIRNYHYLVFRHDFDRSAFQVVETVAQTAPARARLFMNVPTDSAYMFDEMMIFMRLFFGREDLTQFNYNKRPHPEPQAGDYFLVFVREPATPRSTEMLLPESFHTAALGQLKDRLKLAQRFHYERRLLNSYPDAPIFNLVARAGFKLPDCLGMNPAHKRALFMWEPSLVEWRVYRFEK